ncbi:MAG TPA: MFS transporter [Caldimonas sp.]|nr:MFS transporter [Caldimonas sp.]
MSTSANLSSASAFRSLRNPNYRRWAIGAFISNVGTWMQRTAQDWLVLAELTQHSGTAVGVVMALQFGPSLALLPFTGLAADVFDRRKLLLVTQSAMGVLALGLGLLTVFGAVELWHVYAFAFLLGCATAFDAPARQTFVSELVGTADLSNAVALNSTSFQAARMVGPAISGVVIAAFGSGWAFLANAASFAAMIVALARLTVSDRKHHERGALADSGIAEGVRYVRARPDQLVVLGMLFLIATFGLNFPIFIATMAVSVFHAGAHRYGLLTSLLAIGSVAGALLSARRDRPQASVLLTGAAVFGAGCAVAAAMPDYWLFGAALVVIGAASQTFMTTANSTIQLGTDPAMRGRVMAIYLAIAMGSTPLGAPIVGWVADVAGARWALVVGAAAGLGAALLGAMYRRVLSVEARSRVE